MNHLDGLALRNTYLAMRHGESQANVAGIVLSDPAQGVTGYGLTERGREQVRVSALASSLPATTRILSSDFARARETAELTRELLGAPAIELTPALRERAFGEWEGGTHEAYEQVWSQDALDPRHTARGVESAAAVLERTTGLIARLEASHDRATILLVAHGDPLQLLQTGFLRLDPATHRQRPHWPPAEIRNLSS